MAGIFGRLAALLRVCGPAGEQPTAPPPRRVDRDGRQRQVEAEASEAMQRGERVDVVRLGGGATLPDGVRIGRLVLGKDVDPATLPENIECREFVGVGCRLSAFRASWRVTDRLDLSDCVELTALPEGLRIASISLRGCRRLVRLPAGLSAHFLDLTGCGWIEELPDDLDVSIGRLVLRDCRRLRRLPERLGAMSRLDVAGCSLLEEIPADLVVRSAIDIGGTGVRSLPEGCSRAQILWRDVPVDERIAFRPEEISGREVLAEENAERRRVMLDRIGFERFVSDVDAEVLDEDTDAGGPRRLLRVALPGDEPLVCVSVRCPSTDRLYLLRVPPGVKTCRAAVAWTAGFDDPAAYVPEVET